MRRATVTIPAELEGALAEFMAAQPARPSLASVVESALSAFLTESRSSQSRLADVVRARERIVELARGCGALRIGLFGSVARAKDGPESDVDFWVEAGPELTLFDLAKLRAELESELGARVDVLTLGGLSESDRARVVAESLIL